MKYVNLNFKSILLFVIIVFVYGCKSHQENEVQINNRNLIQSRNVNLKYFPSFEEQEKLAFEFAKLSDYSDFVNFLFGATEHSYSLYTYKDKEESDAFEGTLDIDKLTNYQNSDLSKIVHDYCTASYLRFNIVVPTPYAKMKSIDDDKVYVVNALFSQALGKEAQSGIYKVSYINSTPVDDFFIKEDFCNTHKVIVLTFRDYISGWEHFAKGEQSISDWLIKLSVSYQGYGCNRYEDLSKELGNLSNNTLRIPILHSKKTFQQPCDERYDHFCKLGKPETDLTYAKNPKLFGEQLYMLEADPYLTSWSEIRKGETIQYIPIRDNTLGLDLYGHDFFVADTTFLLDDGTKLHIPVQVSEYDPEMKAQRYVVEWL